MKEMIFEGDSLRILFACTADNLSGGLKKHQQVSKPKGKISQGNKKAKEALRDEVDMVKRLFELKKWHSNTLETWVYPREETLRSLKRLVRAMNEEYQLLCKTAREKKEEGLSATPVTKPPSCENKESLGNVTAPSGDEVTEETFAERDLSKELFPSEVEDQRSTIRIKPHGKLNVT